MIVKIFGKTYNLDKDTNYKPFKIEDASTKMTYIVKISRGDIEINNVSRQLFEASALPAGSPCPRCNGSGRVN